MKTPQEIEAINNERKKALALLEQAKQIFKDTGCSLGAHTVNECIGTLKDDGCDEY